MKLLIKISILLLVSQLTGVVRAQILSDYDKILERVQEELRPKVGTEVTTNTNASCFQSNLLADGSWSDIRYKDSTNVPWQANYHLMRIHTMALAYTMTGGNLAGNTALYNSVVKALTYWNTRNPTSINWYFNVIDSPQRIGRILAILRAGQNALPVDLESNLIQKMNRDAPEAQTGFNTIAVALHQLYRACLTSDSDLMNASVNRATGPVSYTVGEGIQYDNSFLQHGPQLYTFSYGTGFLSQLVAIAGYVNGTSYAISDGKKTLLSQFIRTIYLNSVRGPYADFNGMGRTISRVNDQRLNSLPAILSAWRLYDTDNQADYDNAISRLNRTRSASYGVVAKHYHAWRADYSLHVRPAYTIGLRTVSTRTVKVESVNDATAKENLKGLFLTEGVTSIAVNGNEYFNIFPVWDWNKLPGTTTPALNSIQPRPRNWGVYPGSASFVGGVSDSLRGASVYAMNDYGVKVKKAWFHFDDEVVCMGSSLSSTAVEGINTTVNQCLADGSVIVGTTTSTQPFSSGSMTFAGNLQWVLHDSVGYFFPKGGNIAISHQTQTGTWSSINTSTTAPPPGLSCQASSTVSTAVSDNVSADVFKLYVEHGVKPANANYAYILVPGLTSSAQMQTYQQASKVTILANTDSVQAVYHSGLNNWQFVLYNQKGYWNNGQPVQIKADRACIVMLQQLSNGKVKVSIADPVQLSTPINLQLILPGFGEARTLVCDMPGGVHAGSTNVFIIDKQINTTAIGDAYVRDGSYALMNYGQSEDLTVKNDASGYQRETYLKFNLTNVDPAFTTAKLKMKIKWADTNVQTAQWQVSFVSDDSWSETGINWTNKPVSTTVNSITMSGTTSGFVEWDVTNIVKTELNGTGRYVSLKLLNTVPNGNGTIIFYSREATDLTLRPTITIDYNTPTGAARMGSEIATVELPEKEGDLENLVSMYPNPFTEELAILAGETTTEIAVYNNLGNTIIQIPVTKNTIIKVPTKLWSSGMYFILFRDEKGRQVGKRVVKL